MSAAKRLGRYRVGERIGTGGVADVFLAEMDGAEGFAKAVVLKCLRPHVADMPEVVESLIEEARLAQRLQHGSIVQVFDFAVDGGVPYVVMEHVDGCTLRELGKDLARRDETLPLEAAVYVVEQVAAALEHAHGLLDIEGMPLSIVHRDVKPSNILLSRDGLVKLADFGVAKVADRGRETLPGVLKGTPTYWSPEQAAGKPVDGRADVYGLAVVTRELVCGGAGDPPHDPRVDATLLALIEQGTAEKAADRVASMKEFATRLRDWCGDARVRPGADRIAALVRRARRDKPAAVRIALDSALFSTAKGDATLQQLPADASVSALTSPGWRRPAIAGAAAAAVAALIVLSLRSPDVPDEPAPPDDTATAPAKIPDAPATIPTTPQALAQPNAAADSSDSGSDSGSGPDSDSGSDSDPDPDSLGGAMPSSGAATGDPVPTKTPPKARKGLLKVNTLPWANVSIDGRSYGRVPVDVLLAPGRHRVVLENPMVGTKEVVVTIKRGGEVSLIRWPS